MLPALQREVVDKRKWASDEEVMDWYAIGQCTPGVIAVNTATFVGQKQAGVCRRRTSSHLLIFLLVFAGSVFLNISPVLYVLAAAVAGIVIRELEARKA